MQPCTVCACVKVTIFARAPQPTLTDAFIFSSTVVNHSSMRISRRLGRLFHQDSMEHARPRRRGTLMPTIGQMERISAQRTSQDVPRNGL